MDPVLAGEVTISKALLSAVYDVVADVMEGDPWYKPFDELTACIL
jgi:hypothetical protein